MRSIVEINDSDLEDGCALCPMNYDYQGCLAFHGSAKDDPMLNWEWDGCPDERPNDCPLIPLSCASCPEMDNPDSCISHLQSALKWHDEHVPRPTNPRNTCVVLQGQKPPEEVLFVRDEGGVTHYLPEGTCHLEECEHEREIPYDLLECDGGWYTEVTHDCDECGYENVDPNIRFCGGCGRKVVTE